MIVKGLKIVQMRDWVADKPWVLDNGTRGVTPANHKIICMDEQGDIVNCTFVTPQPLQLAKGSTIDIRLVGSFRLNNFAWDGKAELLTNAK